MDRTGHDLGYAVPVQTMFDLSKDWYAGRMDEDWSPPNAPEAEAMFASHGLTGEFWSLRRPPSGN